MYCDALVEDGTWRSNFFASGVDFNNMNWGGAVQDIYANVMSLPDQTNNDLTSAPSFTEVSNELTSLQTGLCAGGCDANRSRVVLKSMCAAALGSAAMLVQ
jgi:hypothetical protein